MPFTPLAETVGSLNNTYSGYRDPKKQFLHSKMSLVENLNTGLLRDVLCWKY